MPDEDKTFIGSLVLDLRITTSGAHTINGGHKNENRFSADSRVEMYCVLKRQRIRTIQKFNNFHTCNV